MTTLWQSVRYNYSEGGATQVASRTLWKARQWIRSDTVWLVYRANTQTEPQSPMPRLSRRELTFQELNEHRYFKALILPEFTRNRLESGAVCHGFFTQSRLVTIGWTTQGHLELEPGVTVTHNGATGIFDCYTAPEYRSRGFYTESLLALRDAIREAGTDEAIIAVDPVNAASVKGIERAGFLPFCRLTRARRCGKDRLLKQNFNLQRLTH